MQSAVVHLLLVTLLCIAFIWLTDSYNVIGFLKVIAGYKVCNLGLIAALLLAVLCSYHITFNNGIQN